MRRVVDRWLRLAFVVGAFTCVVGASPVVVAAAPEWATDTHAVLWQDAANPDGDPVVGAADPEPTEPGNPPVVSDPIAVDPNILLWQSLLGVIASLGVSAVARAFPGADPNSTLKRAITLGVVAILMGVVDTMLRGVFNTSNYLASVLTIATAAVAFYRGWFATSTLAARIEGKALVG